MSGSSIDVFTDYMVSTGPSFLTGPEDIVNDAVKTTYTLPRFIFGKSMREMIQGGNSIKDNIFLGADSNSANYKPNAEFNYRNPQVLTQWSIPWRYTKDEMVWTDHEIGLNTGEMSDGARHHKFKTLKYSKEQNLYTGLMQFLDDQFWAQPDVVEMEASDGEKPYTLAAFITQAGSGSPPTAGSTGIAPLDGFGGAWSTVMGINPTTKVAWRNAVEPYDGIGLASAGGVVAHIFVAMSRMYYRLRFDRLPRQPQYSDPTSVPTFIPCSLNGISKFEAALRMNQDTFVAAGRQDPAFDGPQFRGIELVYVSDLDTAALYNNTGTPAAEAGAAQIGARFWFVNGQYVLKVIHRDRFFYKKPPFSPSKQPYTHIMIVDIWHNNVCRSRRRHGIVAPSVNL